MQTAKDLTERTLGADRLDVGQLGSKRQPMRVTAVDHTLAGRQRRGSGNRPLRQEIAGVDCEPVDLAELAITQNAHSVARNEHLAQFRTLELERRPRRHDDPAPGFGNVLLIEALPNAQNHVDDFDLTRGRIAPHRADRRAGDAEVDVG